MIKLVDLLKEALSVSKAKELYSIQKSNKVIQYQNEIFDKLKSSPEYIKSNKTGDRLYFKFIEKNEEDEKINASNPNFEINKLLQNNNYEIKNYIKGIAIDKYGREVKIGKVLQSLDPNLLRKFNTDKTRESSKKENQIIVISKNPYDIGGMSTDRGWTSCMNLYTGANAGYVNCDIKEGTIIAYLTSNDDLNIKNPQARILIKPFINKKKSKDIIYVPENIAYGTAPKSFRVFIDKIFEDFYPKKGIYSLIKSLYVDDAENEDEERYIDLTSYQKDKRDINIANKIIKGIPLSKDELKLSSLILVDKNIESIPNGLNIDNLLSLADNPKLKYLPNDIKVGGDIWLSNTGIEDLPKNLKINRDISLGDTPLAKKYDNNPNEIRKAYPNIKGQILLL